MEIDKKTEPARNFKKDYWQQATSKFQDEKNHLLPYDFMNLEVKKIKNLIGVQLREEMLKTGKNVFKCDDTFTIGSKGIDNFYSLIERALATELNDYQRECKVIEKQCANFIKASKKHGSLQAFFDEKMVCWEALNDLIEFVDVNMNGAYHLLRKLEIQLHYFNRDIWNNFLKRNAMEYKPFVALARAGEILKFIEAYKLNLELLELNKKEFLAGPQAGPDKDKESKIFDKGMLECEDCLEQIQQKYEHHVRIWMRGNSATNSIELEDKTQYKPELQLKAWIVQMWMDEPHHNETIPKSAQEIHHKYSKGSTSGENNPTRAAQRESACYNDFDAWMVIIHTMGFMLIYYGNITTTYDYIKVLGLPGTLSALTSSITPFAAFLSTFHYAKWIKQEYYWSYVVSHITLVLGIFFYYISYTFDSYIPLLIGRFLFGYGGGRVITKSFISYIIKPKFKTLYSSYLVCLTATAITGGSGISALTEYLGEGKFLGTKYAKYNVYSGVLTAVLVLFAALMLITFEDIPASRGGRLHKKKEKNIPNTREDDQVIGVGRTLVQQKRDRDDYSSNDHVSNIQSFEYSEVGGLVNSSSDSNDPETAHMKGLEVIKSTVIVKQYFPIYFLFAIFTLCKMTQEAAITEIPFMLEIYHEWTSQEIGFTIAAFTPFTVVMSLLPGILAMNKFSNKKMMVVFSSLLIISMLLKVNWRYDEPINPWYYIVTTCITLALTFATEVTMTALFYEWQPYYIKKTFWSAGLLSGLGDTAGKTLGNVALTIVKLTVGKEPMPFYLWSFFVPVWLLVLVLVFSNWAELNLIPRARVDIDVNKLKKLNMNGMTKADLFGHVSKKSETSDTPSIQLVKL